MMLLSGPFAFDAIFIAPYSAHPAVYVCAGDLKPDVAPERFLHTPQPMPCRPPKTTVCAFDTLEIDAKLSDAYALINSSYEGFQAPGTTWDRRFNRLPTDLKGPLSMGFSSKNIVGLPE